MLTILMTNKSPGGVLTKSNDIPPLLGPAYSPVPPSSDIFRLVFCCYYFRSLKIENVCLLLVQWYKVNSIGFVSGFPMNSTSFHEMLYYQGWIQVGLSLYLGFCWKA